jgi:hypothetical protein
LSANYIMSIRSDEDNGPALTVDMSVENGHPVVTRVSVVPAPDGSLVPIEVATAIGVPAFLQAVLMCMTPGALTDARPEIAPDAVETTATKRTASRQKAPRGKGKNDTPEDLGATYWRLGSIAKVASHYGVDKHTARQWINRLTNRTNVLSNRRVR